MRQISITICILLLSVVTATAADYPKPAESDYTIPNFHFHNGQTLPSLRIHYRTLGSPQNPAVLILHGTTGSGAQFIRPEFAGELFGKGHLLDAEKYYLILPDDIGHGNSSKPSDGLRAQFPNYAYLDMIAAEHQLITDGLKLTHLRLVMGTSMGGMHTWLWGETYPEFMDALMPLASLPIQISGRNRMWRKMISESIRTDPQWQNGNYTTQPNGLRFAAEMLYFMGDNPLQRYKEFPTGAQADKALDDYADKAMKTMDANDVLYAVESSRDYDPAPAPRIHPRPANRHQFRR